MVASVIASTEGELGEPVAQDGRVVAADVQASAMQEEAAQ
jgi:hypothetical protein